VEAPDGTGPKRRFSLFQGVSGGVSGVFQKHFITVSGKTDDISSFVLMEDPT
jgi:hypothetical protein